MLKMIRVQAFKLSSLTASLFTAHACVQCSPLLIGICVTSIYFCIVCTTALRPGFVDFRLFSLVLLNYSSLREVVGL